MTETQREKIINEILNDYGNPTYLNKTKDNSFEKVRGTALWELWYGRKHDDFCTRTLRDNYEIAKRNNTLSDFDAKLMCLYNSFQEEFDKLI